MTTSHEQLQLFGRLCQCGREHRILLVQCNIFVPRFFALFRSECIILQKPAHIPRPQKLCSASTFGLHSTCVFLALSALCGDCDNHAICKHECMGPPLGTMLKLSLFTTLSLTAEMPAHSRGIYLTVLVPSWLRRVILQQEILTMPVT